MERLRRCPTCLQRQPLERRTRGGTSNLTYVKIKEGTTVSIVDQGGEPHTFTEVTQFGGGFIFRLNGPGEDTVPECTNGFSKVGVAKTRILQGSTFKVTGLSKGEHRFQCCIHPWMRVTVDVK